eukprot:5627646-Amphidinium_carterae.1
MSAVAMQDPRLTSNSLDRNEGLPPPTSRKPQYNNQHVESSECKGGGMKDWRSEGRARGPEGAVGWRVGRSVGAPTPANSKTPRAKTIL